MIINKLYFILVLSILLAACESAVETSKDSSEGENTSNVEAVKASSILRIPDEIIEEDGVRVGLHVYDRFRHYLKADNDTTYVVNFWATWCKPCVEELHHFEELYQNYKDKKVRLILVSLDFEDKIKSNLIPYIIKKDLKGEVIVLRQKSMNTWIDQIDPSWSGALPATIIYNKNKRAFYEQSFDYKQLETALQEIL